MSYNRDMAESFNSKRVVFPRGGQKDFIDRAKRKVPVRDIAKICHLSERTIRDWRREKFLMDFDALRKICTTTKIPLPLNIKLKDKYWYGLKGASVGGKAMWKKYGRIGNDPEYRKKKWYEWWEREGKYKQNKIFNAPKPIKEPKFSKELAEFAGIMLGDGGISKYQVYVTLHSRDDKDYSKFVNKLIKKLFKVPIRKFLRKEDSTIRLVISRISLVKFCVQKGSLKIGNKIKQQVDIPRWIKNDKAYSIACLRGLIDTDGCVFIHRYMSDGKQYVYKKVSFTSHSKPLLRSVLKILKNLNIGARITKTWRDVRIDAQRDVKKYVEIVGFHNQKNLKKYWD